MSKVISNSQARTLRRQLQCVLVANTQGAYMQLVRSRRSNDGERTTYLTTSIGVVSSYSTEGFALLKTSTGGAISFSIEGLALFPTSRAGGNSLSITGVALSLRIGSFESPTISENPNLWLIGVGLRMIGLISGTPRTTRRKGVGAARTVVENANNGSKMIVECMTGEGGLWCLR